MLLKAVLFDLDGTLLDIDMDYFLTQYFREMTKMAEEKGLVLPDLVDRLWKSTRAMMSNLDPNRTNREVFEEDFFRDAPYAPQILWPFFDEFYHHRFSRLKVHTKPFPEVRSIMEKVFAKGHRVAIATNSVFPEVAIRQRLDWAGIGDFEYSLITSYEVMHFTKPHVEYYKEIADYLKVRPEECLMVGNDVSEDLAARRLGMKTFLVKDRLINTGHLPVKADWEGYLSDLLHFFSG